MCQGVGDASFGGHRDLGMGADLRAVAHSRLRVPSARGPRFSAVVPVEHCIGMGRTVQVGPDTRCGSAGARDAPQTFCLRAQSTSSTPPLTRAHGRLFTGNHSLDLRVIRPPVRVPRGHLPQGHQRVVVLQTHPHDERARYHVLRWQIPRRCPGHVRHLHQVCELLPGQIVHPAGKPRDLPGRISANAQAGASVDRATQPALKRRLSRHAARCGASVSQCLTSRSPTGSVTPPWSCGTRAGPECSACSSCRNAARRSLSRPSPTKDIHQPFPPNGPSSQVADPSGGKQCTRS